MHVRGPHGRRGARHDPRAPPPLHGSDPKDLIVRLVSLGDPTTALFVEVRLEPGVLHDIARSHLLATLARAVSLLVAIGLLSDRVIIPGDVLLAPV